MRRYSHLAAFVAVAGLAALLGVSCGDGDSFTAPSAPVATPPPTDSTPPASGGSGEGTCALGDGDESAPCDRTFSELDHHVERAMNILVEEQPQLFDLNIEKGAETRQYLVVQKEEYIDGLVDELRKMGLCAGRSISDYEIVQIKNSNDFSEDFDVYTSDSFMRRGGGAYRRTCTPASFPVVRPPGAPPVGSGCGLPFPPPISRLKVHTQYRGSEYDTLDSTPLVGHDVQYCASIGFRDGRSLCPVRQEGHPERVACENWAMGNARDTGRPGPTWTTPEGSYCTDGDSGCKNADNQYKLWVWKTGRYAACAANGACGYEDYVR